MMHTNMRSTKKWSMSLLPEIKNDISDFIQNEVKQNKKKQSAQSRTVSNCRR